MGACQESTNAVPYRTPESVLAAEQPSRGRVKNAAAKLDVAATCAVQRGEVGHRLFSVGMQSHWVPGHAENLVTGHHIAENKNPHAMLLSRPQPAGISRSCMLHAGSVKTSSLKALAELHDIMQPFTDPEQLFNLF